MYLTFTRSPEGGVDVPYIYTLTRGWGLCTLHLHAHQRVEFMYLLHAHQRVELMYLTFTRSPDGGVYVPYIYTLTRGWS